MDTADARRRLAELDASLERTAAEILEVLSTDVPAFVQRTVRGAFVEFEGADDLADDALQAMKAETLETSASLRAELREALQPVAAWDWTGEQAPPSDAPDLTPHPGVSAVLGRVGSQVSDLLRRHGLADQEVTYHLPSYFVSGRLMKSLVESYWRILSERFLVQQVLAESAGTEQRDERAQRWDEA
jgi:hypothetical protein